MDKQTQIKLEREIDKLKNYLSNFETMSVLGLIANDLRIHFNVKPNFAEINLASPHKELLYVAGLLLSSEQKKRKMFSENNYRKVKKDVSKITSMYSLLFFPTKDEIEKGLSEEWREARDVSMPVFLHYFNTTPLYYKEQVIERIRDWFFPLNEEFIKHHSFDVNTLINFYEFITTYLQDYFDKLIILRDNASKERDSFMNSDEFQKANNLEEQRELAQKHPVKEIFEKFFQHIGLVHYIPIAELKLKFGDDVANEIIKIFSITREQRDFRYYTEQNPVEISPLWKLSDEHLFCPFLEQLLNAIYHYLYEYFEKSSIQQQFYSNRDKQSEIKTRKIFEIFFGKEAMFYDSAYENDKASNEHDLIIKLDEVLFIVEVKASKQKEPFRDPDKAFTRIKRDFKSDRGIQKAFDQAYNLKTLINSQEKTKLYDSKGELLVELEKSTIKKVYIVCVTVEQLGMLASNLSLLLEKNENEPYPLAINLYDLETLIEGFKYKQKSKVDLLTYLDEREIFHEQLFASDELEIAGSFLSYGSLSKTITNKDVHMFFTPDMSSIFDQIYFEKHGITYELEQSKEPVLTDLRKEMEEIFSSLPKQKNRPKNKKKKYKPKRIIRKKKKKKKR